MKDYIPGSIISLVCLIILFIINSQVYDGVMSLKALIPLLALQVIFFKYLITEKKRIEYTIFLVILVVVLYLSVPALTQKEATEKVMDVYNVTITEATTVPTDAGSGWNPFVADKVYFFRGNTSEENMTLLVDGNGEIFKAQK